MCICFQEQLDGVVGIGDHADGELDDSWGVVPAPWFLPLFSKEECSVPLFFE
jgi:hypothetical protein